MKWLIPFGSWNDKSHFYMDWVLSAGIEPAAHRTRDPFPPDLSAFDALLLSGGDDVNPMLYGCEPEQETKGIDPERDTRESELIQAFLRERKPIFGICRGIQMLQVALGGALIQHVPRRLAASDTESHDTPQQTDATHALIPMTDTDMGRHLASVTTVNSRHHQALDPDRLPHRLRVAARSPAGIIEAVEGVGFAAPVQAVQWHPERLPLTHPGSRLLLDLWARHADESPGRMAGPAQEA